MPQSEDAIVPSQDPLDFDFAPQPWDASGEDLSVPRLVVPIAELPLLSPVGRGPISGEHLLEGHTVGLSNLSLVLGETPPGQGTRLHRHTCEEVIVVHSGRGMFTVGDTTVEVCPGEVVIIPAGAPHRFVNHTHETLIHTDVFGEPFFFSGDPHRSGVMVTAFTRFMSVAMAKEKQKQPGR